MMRICCRSTGSSVRDNSLTWWSSDSDASERAVGVTANGRCGLSCTGCDEQELLIDTRCRCGRGSGGVGGAANRRSPSPARRQC